MEGSAGTRENAALSPGAPASRPAPRKLRHRLLLAVLVPCAGGFLAFGLLAHEVARRTLDDEMSRRLSASAVGVAMQILPEQILAVDAGDEGSRTYANLTARLDQVRERLGVRRVVLLARDLTARGDSERRVALGAAAHEFRTDQFEVDLALGGKPVASPLFTGRDGRPYKRGYAPIGKPGAGTPVAGLAMVEGAAEFSRPLARFRRWLLLWGVVAVMLLVGLTMLIAGRITSPLSRLSDAAARIGRGELEVRIPVQGRDEIAALAHTFDEMRGALRARDERLQMMLAGIAHEVRNPLGGLALFAGLLREGLVQQPERLQEVARLEREIAYLDKVVSEFLEYARRPALVKAAVLVPELFEAVREAAGAPSNLRIDRPAGLTIQGDAGQLRRALLNLVRNALTAAPGGAVVLSAHRDASGGRTIIEVRDSGPGVAADLRDKIFAPFFTTREKGTGLGLAFVRDIVSDHGGAIEVGTAPEGGAAFRITL